MKKILLFFMVMFLLPLILAANIDVNENYSQKETLIAKVSGEFITSITENNVYFYRRHVRIPTDFEISRIENSYYIYSILPDTPDNYSISIEGVQYKEDSQILTENIVGTFKISNDTADFNIRPGFVKTSENFYINIKNLKSEEIEVEIKTSETSSSGSIFSSIFSGQDSSENKITIGAKETKKINFQVSNFKETSLKIIEFNSGNVSYSLPVYIIPDDTDSSQGDSSDSGEITLNQSIEDIPSDSQSPPVNQQNSVKKCNELGGEICSSNEECSGESRYASDGKCCFGECNEEKKNSTWKILGWAIIVVLVIVVYWFFIKKYLGTRRKLNILSVAKGK